MKSSNSTLVYSTETGRMCPGCGQAIDRCACRQGVHSAMAGDGVVRVARQSKGRGGKTVTLVKGVALDAVALAALGKQLRGACGAGGTVKDGVIEVQGEHTERVLQLLEQLGHRPKLSG